MHYLNPLYKDFQTVFCPLFPKKITIKLIFICLFILSKTSVSAFGVIESFTPVSGSVGTIVSIQGHGFTNTPADIIVYFGLVKAQIISATSQQIDVKVPAGASYKPLSVTINGLTSYSRLPFVPTFESAGDVPSYISFLPNQILLSPTTPFSLATADFDGDGRPDLAVANAIRTGFTVTLSVFKNIIVDGVTSFSNIVVITDNVTAHPADTDLISIADIDGDGKLDIIVSKDWNKVWVYRNTSTIGNISFDEGHTFTVAFDGFQTGVVTVGDLNSDGKPDLVTGGGRSSAFSVLVNTSTPGSISFQDNKLFDLQDLGILSTSVSEVALADFTGDGKPDVIISGVESASEHIKSKVIILANTTTANELSFALESSQSVPVFSYTRFTVADFNNDGLVDILAKNDTAFYVLKNTSTYPATSYDVLSFPALSNSYGISAADMDGDGKTDILSTNTNLVLVYKNISSAGKVAFVESLDFRSRGVEHISPGDIDMDGKPDILCANTRENNFSVMKYSGLWSGVKTICPHGGTSFASYKTGLSYQWQLSTDSGANFVNLSNNEYYNGVTSNKIMLTAIPSSFYGYKYRCLVDGVANNEVYELKFATYWTGVSDREWGNAANWSCGQVPDANTDVVVENGFIQINGDFSCGSILVKSGAIVAVGAGYKLTVTH